MEIADEDILDACEIVMNLEISNAVYVELINGKRLIKRIRVSHRQDAMKLGRKICLAMDSLVSIKNRGLNKTEIKQIVSFMKSLTGPDMKLKIPTKFPQ